MSQIGVSYTPSGGSPVYNFIFSNFIDQELPRSYVNNVDFGFSAGGSAVISGSANLQKRIWAISSPLPDAEAASFDTMFQAWDADRASSLSAAVGISDTTFGATVNASAVFSTAPTYSRWGPYYMLVSFGLTEV